MCNNDTEPGGWTTLILLVLYAACIGLLGYFFYGLLSGHHG